MAQEKNEVHKTFFKLLEVVDLKQKNDFQNFVSLYPELEKFKKFVDLTPAQLVQFTIEVGRLALLKSKDLVIQDLKTNLEKFVKTKNVDEVLDSAKTIINLFNEIQKISDKKFDRDFKDEVTK